MPSAVTVTTPPSFQSIRLIAADIKLAHSVFALPFALLAAFMAALGPTRGTYFVSGADGGIGWQGHPYLHPDYSSEFWLRFAGQLTLIVLAMIAARTVAMLANRLLDARIDRDNPRTAGRAIPSGRLSPSTALAVLLACAVAFVLVCAAFGWWYGNWWPAILAAPVLIWISAYALLKRFTALCHLYLGSSLAISPLAAALAIQPESIIPWSPAFQPALWLISAMVLCWVAGFDVIYALQDVQVDRAQGLHSMPSRLGVARALWISRGLHAASAACLFAAWLIDPRFGILFGIAVLIGIALLLYEHLTVARWGTTKIALAFFALNGIISCALGVLGIADVVIS